MRTAEGAAEPNSAEPGPSDGPPAATGASADIVPPEGRVAQDDRRRGESPDREAARDHREPRDHPARDYPARDDRRRGESAMERSLRALVSTRTTQLPFDVAMRAREVAQPSAQDLSEAERDLVLVRRHYVPPAPLITKKADGSGRTGAGRADDAARGDRNDKADRGRGRRSGRG